MKNENLKIKAIVQRGHIHAVQMAPTNMLTFYLMVVIKGNLELMLCVTVGYLKRKLVLNM